MEFTKKVIAEMPKAYAVGAFDGPDARSFVVGVEKDGPIRRFALEGTAMETVAEGPGGVMTVTQVPGRDDQLLATCEFFSPNFGGDTAHIRTYTRAADGTWDSTKLCDLPYVHRFGLLTGADGQLWLIACTIKGACRQIKNDWQRPGAVWAAPLDGCLEDHDDANQIELTELAGCQLQNHGFWVAPDRSYALISTAAGVFRYMPPVVTGDPWDVACLIVQPTSDICVADFDGDGKDEILTLSSFHGDTLSIWHAGAASDTYERVWEDPEKRPFLHAIWSGELGGTVCAVVGNRKGGRDLLRVFYADGSYQVEAIDHDRGPANCLVTMDESGTQRVVAANRETDEVALYELVR
ncbi:MAG: hypothetical protein MR611_00815 [Coriobacteriaceae bacterium]|nr:hypothetical protein [Coriobacteriaceae bacterium]